MLDVEGTKTSTPLHPREDMNAEKLLDQSISKMTTASKCTMDHATVHNHEKNKMNRVSTRIEMKTKTSGKSSKDDSSIPCDEQQ